MFIIFFYLNLQDIKEGTEHKYVLKKHNKNSLNAHVETL